jgi:hypothetical protein
MDTQVSKLFQSRSGTLTQSSINAIRHLTPLLMSLAAYFQSGSRLVCDSSTWGARLQCCFNFDSLDHMPALQKRVMDAKDDNEPVLKTSVPRLSSYFHRPPLSDTGRTALEDPTLFNWKDRWNLPRLTSLDLDGPSGAVFCFKWLMCCPFLETVRLTAMNDRQRLPLSSSSKHAYIVDTRDPLQSHHHLSTLEYVHDTEVGPGMAPLVESKLRSLTLRDR